MLHVDDDQDDRFLIGSAINNIDSAIQILEAENGWRAIDYLKEAYLDGQLPSLIILDFNMPLINGMETYKEIRKYPEFSSIPVVLFTTFHNRREDDYWDSENVATFTKPATFKELTKSIREILNYCLPR
ncbi:response regulator [Niastella populi]|nr:response regulator [Niastella populi]